jgi:hypothetical protein
MILVHHFTVLPALKMIMTNGAIRPSGCESDILKDNRMPVIWFTRVRDVYNPTALKGGFRSFQEQSSFWTGVRITILESCAPLSWMGYARVSNLKRSLNRLLGSPLVEGRYVEAVCGWCVDCH